MMKVIVFAVTFTVATATFKPHHHHHFIPPGPGDSRSPCPALNALANHGYLPRNGLDWNATEVVQTLKDVYNVDPSLGSGLALAAVFLTGNTSTQSFSLGEYSGKEAVSGGIGLSHHNRIEHDASLSRADAFTGDNHSFNATMYCNLKRIAAKLNGGAFNTDVLSLHRFNQYQASKVNPDFTFGPIQWFLGYGEAALSLNVFGKNNTATAAAFDSFFAKERIPDDFIKNSIALTPKILFLSALEVYNKNPVPIQGIDTLPQKLDGSECFILKLIQGTFPDAAQDLINYIANNTGRDLPANCTVV
ncbi:Chloroperoxidase [Jimgerdemannia flammicorona]|uniref:Chloroperoxidase n=1 Tax=Jimgerdemannia flammicorona TaxID=994334 RepID=A0A433D0M7_9FUNG|nr:Chloroperoxidase [Jimgerdemannia flammicorona]